ncbi:MAG: tRNA dihydrouridine(20/20a) synthase DusA [Steroidobacteraceae bacterium]
MIDRRLSVAPMLDWTDRHCRYFLRGFSPRILLYTEMITASAILRGDRDRLLEFGRAEHPVALQLGGCEPDYLGAATRDAMEFGYDEINLNCGCPSDKVQKGAFGACLMSEPALVGDCVAAMCEASDVPVTVKMRIGTIRGGGARDAHAMVREFDERDYDALCDFIVSIRAAGADAAIIHARKAVLGGWSPQENREIPPLRYDIVRRIKDDFPDLPVVVNGGIRTVEAAMEMLDWCDGVMLGREAYHHPMVLAQIDAAMCAVAGETCETPTVEQMLERMARYAEDQLARGERLHAITRHMLGLLSHNKGAREYRRLLSEGARERDAGPEIIRRAASLAA